jgi:hypothetical protein
MQTWNPREQAKSSRDILGLGRDVVESTLLEGSIKNALEGIRRLKLTHRFWEKNMG